MEKVVDRKKSFKSKVLGVLFALFFAFASLGLGIFFGGTSVPEAASYDSYFCLRDDYYIQATNQDIFGTCWAFANNKAIEEYLAQTTGEHFELSEAYFALASSELDKYNSDKLIGGGGNAETIQEAVVNDGYGFVLESDFQHGDLYYTSIEVRGELLSSYKQKADTHTIKKMVVNEASYSLDTNKPKEYLTKYKNCTINVFSFEIKTNQSTGKQEIHPANTEGGHGVNVIGWDDNYPCLNGTKGAYIILNSHKNYDRAGVCYLPYKSNFARDYAKVFSYQITLADDYVYLKSTPNDYVVNMDEAHRSSTNFTGSQMVLKDKNIFDVNDEDFELVYEFPKKTGLNYTLQIMQGDVDRTGDFSIIKNNNICTIEKKNDVESGGYKIVMDYSYTNGSSHVNNTIVKQFFLLDGLELAEVEIAISDNSKYFNTLKTDSTSYTDNYIYIPQALPNESFQTMLRLYIMPGYANVASYELKRNGVKVGTVLEYYETPQDGSHTADSHFIGINLPFNLLYEGQNILDFTLRNAGHTKTYKIVVSKDSDYRFNASAQTSSPGLITMLNIDLGGGELEQNYPTQIQISNGDFRSYALPEPYRDGYKFVGYQYYRSSSNYWLNIGKNNANGKYEVVREYINRSSKGNYGTYSFQGSYGSQNYYNSIIVRAKWEEEENPIVTSSAGIETNDFDYNQYITLSLNVDGASDIEWTVDGQSVSPEIGQRRAGSYLIRVTFNLNGEQKTYKKIIYVHYHSYTLRVSGTSFVYNGQVQVPTVESEDTLVEGNDYKLQKEESINAGQYTLKIIPLNDSIVIENSVIPYVIEKRPLHIWFKGQMLNLGDSHKPVQYTIGEGDWVEKEPLQIEFDYSGLNNKKEGTYEIPVSYKNLTDNYDLIEENGKPIIEVLPVNFDPDKEMNIVLKSIDGQDTNDFVYGQFIMLSVSKYSGIIDTIEYVIDGTKRYSSRTQYINDKFGFGEHTITADITLVNGQKVNITPIVFNVEKAKITITALSIKAYLGDEQKVLRYKIDSDYAVDDLQISCILSDEFDKDVVGEYLITPIATGDAIDNYEITYVSGTYSVVQQVQDTSERTILIIIVCSIAGVILIGFVLMLLDRKHRKGELADWE